MKKHIIVLVLAVAVVGVTGCQCRPFRLRGARCRATTPPAVAPAYAPPAAAYPSTTCSPPTTCSPATTSSASAYSSSMSDICVSDGGQSQPVVVQEFPTSPIIESNGQVVNRPIVTGGTMYAGDSDPAAMIPGPELAPAPVAN